MVRGKNGSGTKPTMFQSSLDSWRHLVKLDDCACRRLTGDLSNSPGVTVVTNCTVEWSGTGLGWSGTIYPSTKREIKPRSPYSRARFLLIATLSKVYADWLPWGIPSMFKARKDSLEPKQYSHNAHHNEAPFGSKMLLSLYYFGL